MNQLLFPPSQTEEDSANTKQPEEK